MDTDLAYMAGILDGEGSICLTRINYGKSLSPTVSVDSTDRELLEWIHEQFGGHLTNKNRADAKRKQAWTWRIKGRIAIDFLARLMPYLKIERKRQRASLLIEEYREIVPRNGRYTPEMLARREEMRERFLAIT